MHNKAHLSVLLRLAVFAVASSLVASAVAQVAGVLTGPEVNVSRMANDQEECAISKNPTNHNQLFVLCNNFGAAGLFAARSTDGGVTWVFPDASDRTIADGDAGQGPAACCDPNLAWDSFGNLFITYLDSGATNVVTILSTDSGVTFTNLASFAGSVDQPSVVAANTTAAGAPVALWIVWNQSGQMMARGAAVTGLGAVGAFGATQTIPGTSGCSFGDVAIAPSGVVVQACENPTGGQGPATIRVNTDADGLGPGNFGASVAATTTNVGGFDFIPPQPQRSVDAEAGLAFDRNPTSPHFGRLYLMYTDEPVNESNDTDIMLRFSDTNGATWSSPPIRVNDDATARSQFLPKIATNPLSGNIGVCWMDARNSAANTAMQMFCTIATPTGATPTFLANAQVSAGTSATNTNPNDYGDYIGMDYFYILGGGQVGGLHPVWPDSSNSTADNPNGTANYDAYTHRITGSAPSNEGDPHLTTVDGVHYNFQSAGEFVSLRDYDGLEIQTRQSPIATSFNPGPDPYDGLATCVSLNTAVAARVGKYRVTFQPNIKGEPDPSGLELRVDGDLRRLDAQGIDLGPGARVIPSAGGGIRLEFPDGTILIATPGWWASESKWYLNVNVLRTSSLEGTMGAIAPGSWLPALPNGMSLGAMPASLHQRYVDLNLRFADAWRVTKDTSLFDYLPGTSTETFTLKDWPRETPPCLLPDAEPVKPMSAGRAREICHPVAGKVTNRDCIFDVMVTGEPGFAKTYLLSQRIRLGATATTVSGDKDRTKAEEPVTFTAIVTRAEPAREGAPLGTVQFMVDGDKEGEPVRLDRLGRATLKFSIAKVGEHSVAATYIPRKGSGFLTSTSEDQTHFVR